MANKLILNKKEKILIGLLVLWQLISVGFMALGVWPVWVSWLNFGLLSIFLIIFDSYASVILLILSIPFFTVLPNPYSSSFPSWRLLFVLLTMVWLVRLAIAQSAFLRRTFLKRFMREQRFHFEHRQPGLFGTALKRVDSRFFPWEKYFALFLLAVIISIFFAHFKVQAVKQLLFIVNIYLFYLVFINVVNTREKMVEVIKATAISLGIIVALGYVQFIASFFTSQFYFWQYWATMVSRVYYGGELSNVLVYSNSWFSYQGTSATLRMFSIMPDSHSFGMIAVFLLAFLLPLTYLYPRPKGTPLVSYWKTKNYLLWYIIRFAGLAVIFSGTRGLWVSMLVPLILSVFFYVKKWERAAMRKLIVSFVIILVFFVMSPLINQGLSALRFANFHENFLSRAASIYDLREDSNVGRLIIWKDSITFAAFHPFGIGFGNFVVSLVPSVPAGATFEQVASIKNLRYNLPQKFVTAHSLYLNLMVELGLAGLLAFLLFWLEYGLNFWQFFKTNRWQENIFTTYATVTAFSYLWFLGYSIFDVTLFNDKVLMYFFISLGLSGLIFRKYKSFAESNSSGLT